ncbi:MAG: hypothetical protein P1U59_08100 [Alcanivorax sp.]|jgi:hypothetical protein|uniref:hypothetical protein n=1 Tax=Alcanivorax sp. TaxID=1872427 RepID=UPI0026218BF9|nr:hypothetical protein [Alcanivorax sp.]MDF1724470.1 hypothetical protein [Alcanivorax sp.]
MNKIMATVMVVLLSACARESLRPDYAYSVNKNSQVQVINPDARYKDHPVISTHGGKLDAGYERFLTDDGKVEEGRIVEDISE